LKAADAPELITADLIEYEALALKLARDPHLLARTRQKLISGRDSVALFDTARFTRHLEAAYTAMLNEA
jgi:protein O-GlcNAc transferase